MANICVPTVDSFKFTISKVYDEPYFKDEVKLTHLSLSLIGQWRRKEIESRGGGLDLD